MPIKCLELYKKGTLVAKHKALVDGGMNEYQAAREIVLEEQNNLHKEINVIRAALKLKAIKLEPQEKIVIEKQTPKEEDKEEPTKQVKINNLVDRTQNLQKMRKNDPKRAFEVNEIKKQAAELGLKYSERDGKIVDANGKPIQKREPITNKTVVKDFDRKAYSKETNDTLDFLVNNEVAAFGFEMVGTDGKRLSKSQIKEALNSVRKGKVNYAAKAMFDFIEDAHSKGGIELEDVITGTRALVPIKEYFDAIKTEEDILAESNAEDLINNKELEQSDEYINQLINDYEQENSRENNESQPSNKGEIIETPSNGTSNKKVDKPKEPTKVEGKEPPKPPTENGEDLEVESGKEIALDHAETEAKRAELGLEPRTPREVKTDIQLELDANKAIKDGFNVKGLINKILSGEKLPNDLDEMILLKYAAGLESKLENLDPKSKEFDETFNEINQTYKASEKGGSELGAAFRMKQKRIFKEDSLGEMLVREAEINMVEDLTEEQRINVVKEYENIKKAKEEWEAKYNKLVEENNKKEAKLTIQKEKAAVQKKSNKTKEDFNSEREKLKQSIKDKWKKASNDGTLMAVPLPYAKQLVEISPDVAKLMRSYIEEGITDLGEIVKNIHADIKDYIEDIKESDVRDIIAGVYNEKRTRSQLAESLRDLRDEAKLIVKIETIENGEIPKTEKKKIERNQKITELRGKIKELTKNGVGLESIKTRTKNEIAKLEDKLAKGDYAKEEKKEPIKLDAEALFLKDKLIKLKQEREIRLMQQQYANRTKWEKVKDYALNILNIPRTIMASADLSAPLRQGIIPTLTHPKLASKAFVEMLKQSVSQKRFDRWFYDLRESEVYETMEKAGLYIADPHDPRLSAKEEQFMNNLGEKLPVVGKIIKGSERAYVSYLNKMRADLFIQGINGFESSGMTMKNSPNVYKAWASFVNNSTGRGKMPEVLENAAPILNSVFFSPRLMAARLNTLNPMYYAKMPKEVRMMALKDMASFVGIGMSMLALAALSGADVEKDPRSPNFGKIKVGDTTYDIWGGFAQYVVEFSQLLSGQTKSATTGVVRDLDSKVFPFKTRLDDVSSFIRGKFAPLPASALNIASGKKVTGERTNIFKEMKGWVTPLVVKDIIEANSKNGIVGALSVGVPATFGIGVQSLSNIPDNADKREKAWQFVSSKKLRIPNPDLEAMKVGKEDKSMTKDEIEKFDKKRIEKIQLGIDKLLEKGRYINIDGVVTFKKANEINQEQLQKVIESISEKATRESKEELFGKQEKTQQEKASDKRMNRLHKSLYK